MAICPPGFRFERCLEQAVDAITDRTTFETPATLKAAGAVPFSIPNSMHHIGWQHAAIYRTQVEGRPQLLKVISGYAAKAQFMNSVLASQIGGPKINRLGVFKDGSHADQYFIEMEELFADRQNSFTLKGAEAAQTTVKFSNAQMDKLAKMMVSAFDRGVELGDVDLIFAENEGVHWIDSGLWELSMKIRLARPLIKAGFFRQYLLTYESLINRIQALDEAGGRRLASSFESRVLLRERIENGEYRSSASPFAPRHLLKRGCEVLADAN